MKIMKLVLIVLSLVLVSCKNSEANLVPNSNNKNSKAAAEEKPRLLSEAFKRYWYAGTAEITSYALQQERYGELREGTAVNIFVTEDFLANEQVKADRSSPENIPVLKLNQTKKYVTGIYPYSVMTSTFSPLNTQNQAIKISHSMQEWCGHAYVQLNNRDDFSIMQHSYFEGEADLETNLPKTWLESELWNQIRIDPTTLPTGDLNILPSFEYFRMSHQKIKAQSAIASLSTKRANAVYTLKYPEAKRTLKITFKTRFPHSIESWTETHANGMTTSAEKIKQIRSAYWSQNSTKFEFLRDSLGVR